MSSSSRRGSSKKSSLASIERENFASETIIDDAETHADSGSLSENKDFTANLLLPLSDLDENDTSSIMEKAPSVSATSEIIEGEEYPASNSPSRTAPFVHPLIIPDGSPTRSTSLSRRRNQFSNKYRSSPSSTSSTATTTTTSTNSSSTRRRQRSGRSIGNRAETIEEEANVGGLRASLDAGMARVRRWIRSRQSEPATPPYAFSSTYSWTHTNSPSSFHNSEDVQSEDDNGNDDDTTDQLHERGDDNATESSITSNLVDDFNPSTVPVWQMRVNQLTPPTIFEETDAAYGNNNQRQRALSEPDAARIRDLLFQRAFTAPQRNMREDRGLFRQRANGVGLTTASSSQLSSSAAEVLYASARSLRSTTDLDQNDLDSGIGVEISTIENSVQNGSGGSNIMINSNSMGASAHVNGDQDPHRQARVRWIMINRRFQVVITIVALIFSLLLFAILVCWIVLTSAYIVSIDKTCDVPLKIYYWLVTLQLIMDVFRTDAMRVFSRWDTIPNRQIPCSMITYNIGYLLYALLILRLGIESVFLNKEATCQETAPELFRTSRVFVSLSISAWLTILLGYLVPFFIVATMLTRNGYTPSPNPQSGSSPNPFTVFPTSMAAPPSCVDELPIVMLEDFPAHYPMECCICMENFRGTEIIVETRCQHIFHKSCCRDWLRHARTCPVCRTDIPTSLEGTVAQEGDRYNVDFGSGSSSLVGRNDLHQEVVSLLRILRRRDSNVRNLDAPGVRVLSAERRETGNLGLPVSMRDIEV